MNLAGCDVLELKLIKRFYFKIKKKKNRAVKKACLLMDGWLREGIVERSFTLARP